MCFPVFPARAKLRTYLRHDLGPDSRRSDRQFDIYDNRPGQYAAVAVGSTLAPFTESGDLTTRLVTLTFLVGVIAIALIVLLPGRTRISPGARSIAYHQSVTLKG